MRVLIFHKSSQVRQNNASQVSGLREGFADALSTGKPIGDNLRIPFSMDQLTQSLSGLRVLVVDDDIDAREFITAVLESYNAIVRTVATANAALEELERFRPDVLLSDIQMPDGDGYSLIRQIRALEATQGHHIPAAAITAYWSEDRETALKAGFEAHLHKLARPHEWAELVAQLAGRASTSDQSGE